VSIATQPVRPGLLQLCPGSHELTLPECQNSPATATAGSSLNIRSVPNVQPRRGPLPYRRVGDGVIVTVVEGRAPARAKAHLTFVPTAAPGPGLAFNALMSADMHVPFPIRASQSGSVDTVY
jgi:hypothetical protein